MIEYFQGDSLRIEIENSDYIKFIEFFTLVDTIPMKVGRQKLLRISKEIDNDYGIILVWNQKTKMIASYDIEHEELINLAPFDEFINNAGKLIDKIF